MSPIYVTRFGGDPWYRRAPRSSFGVRSPTRATILGAVAAVGDVDAEAACVCVGKSYLPTGARRTCCSGGGAAAEAARFRKLARARGARAERRSQRRPTRGA